MSRYYSIFILLFCCTSLFAQDKPVQSENVIGAKFETFPLEEMDKQSAFVAANQQLILGNFDKAITLLDKFLYLNDDEPAAWYALGRAHAAKKTYDKALESIEKAVELDPDNEWYQIPYASLLEETGHAKDAVPIYEKLVRQHPNEEEYYHTLGYLFVLSNQPDKGLAAYDAAEKRFGISPEIVEKKHLIYVASGDIMAATKELQKLVDTYPSSVEFKARLAQFFTSTKNPNAAQSVYESILKLDPNHAEARLALADKKASTNPNSAASDMADIVGDPRADIDAKIKKLFPLVTKLLNTGDAETSTELIKMAALLEKAHPKDPKAWSFSGDVHYLSEQDDIALEKYKTCIDLNPSVFSVWENTMQILFEKGDYTALAKTSEDALDAFPNQAKAYYFYGFAQNKLDKADDALPLLMQAKLMVGDDQMLSFDLQDQIGLSQLILGDDERAETSFATVLEKSNNQHPGALEHYGDLLKKQGKQAEAVKYWEKAQKIYPNSELERKIAAQKG